VSEKYANKTKGDALPENAPKVGVSSSLGSAFVLLANAYMREDNADQALAYFNKAIEYEPGLAEAFGGRGMLLVKQRKGEAPLADLQRYIRLAGSKASPQITQLVQQLEALKERSS
jgi:regulator of sirC expression with transglutaminase-like and TPR domain